MVNYLTSEQVIEINKEVLKEIKVKKADSFKVLSSLKLSKLLEEVERAKGDVYAKAVSLLKGLTQEHPFASGNRRTALVAALEFLKINGCDAKPAFIPKVLQGIRENYYSDKEIIDRFNGVGFVNSKENEKIDLKFIKSIREIIEENRELLEAVGRL